VTARPISIIDGAGRIATIVRGRAADWAVFCAVLPTPCPPITGFGRRSSGIAAAEKHLAWHGRGKPVCPACKAPLMQADQKRCRTNNCEAPR
jgi:hypothetical protein